MNVIRFAPVENSNGNLWHVRGRQPRCYAEVAALHALGITHVLNLRSNFLFGEELNAREADWCRTAGLTHTHIPMSPITPPTRSEVIAALAEFRGRPTYVHCLDGVDRTGVVVAAYRTIVQDWTEAEAVDEMFTEGFHLCRYFWWIPTVKRRLQGL